MTKNYNLVLVGGMPWPQTFATQSQPMHCLLFLRKSCNPGLVVCNWDIEPLDLLNGLALSCYQPSFEV